ncbi:MAG: hypothetical protein RR061_05140 [Muribaculaceae bacterium]
MKSVSNLLLVAVMIIYIFLPLFDLGIFGGQTGFEFTESTLNKSTSLEKIIFALIPFMACFGAIALNCLRNKLWRIASCLCIGIALYFYFNAYQAGGLSMGSMKIAGIGIGYNIAHWLLWAALGMNLLSLIPCLDTCFNKNKAKGESTIEPTE